MNWFPKAAFTNRFAHGFSTVLAIALGATLQHAQAVTLIGGSTNNGNLDLTHEEEVVPGLFLPKPDVWINEGFRSISGPYEDELSSELWAGPAPTPVTTDGVGNLCGGPDCGVFFKPFSGNPNDGAGTGHLYQDNPGTPGGNYTLTGWAGAEANALMEDAEFAVEFLNAANSVIGGSTLSLLPTLFTPNGQPFSYKEYMVMATAPAGTVSVRARVSMIGAMANPAGGDQAFVVDDFTLASDVAAPFNIFQWEYVNPLEPTQGKRESSVFAPGGYGLHAAPGLQATGKNLTKAYLIGADLTNANLNTANLTGADLSHANLTGAKFISANLTDADFTGSQVGGAHLGATNLTFSQLASTASYQAHDLSGIQLPTTNLANANLSGQNLSHANLNSATLTRSNLSDANLTNANLNTTNLTGADLSGATLTDAIIRNANLSSTQITLDQLYSTASYKNHGLAFVQFVGNDLSGANLAGQQLASTSFYAAKLVGADLTNADLTNAELVNADLSHANLMGANLTGAVLTLANLDQANLTNANLSGASFIGANLSGAEIRGANLSQVRFQAFDPYPPFFCGPKGNGVPCAFSKPILIWGIPVPVPDPIGTGISLAQLVSTASYGAHDLSGATLKNNHFDGGNFAGFNLTNANLEGTTFVGANFSGADARGANGLFGIAAPSFIRADGHIAGLTLSAGQSLSIRDYDGNSSGTIPITIDQQLTMASGATLRMLFEADAWDSTISFATGIPVSRGGTLELLFANGINVAAQVGRTVQLFNWIGVNPTGTFNVSSLYTWDLSMLYTTGEVKLLSAFMPGDFNHDNTVPEPSAVFLAVTVLGLWRVRRRFGRAQLSLCIAAFLLVNIGTNTRADTFGSGSNTFNIDFVTIGNPGNAVDFTGRPNAAGGVDYSYRMGKFEISEQMIDKANTVGGLGLTKGPTLGPDKPVTLSWNEAARFVNWLNTSTGSTPAYKFAIQPGQNGYIANEYVQLWSASDAGYDPNNLYRNSLARYFLPGVNEWFKAAYYDPIRFVYYDWPTGSNSIPDGINFVGDPNFDAVFFDRGCFACFPNPLPNDITDVGLLSPYGTAGQGGNMSEWEETNFDLGNGPSFYRGVRGGFWSSGNTDLQASERSLGFAAGGGVGFRVASIPVPEPSAVFLLTIGVVAGSMSRRRRPARILVPLLGLLLLPCSRSLADAPNIQLTKIGDPIWKPVDFQLFSAPATPFNSAFGQVYNTLLPYDTPLATTYVPHAPPYDTELTAGALAGGYVSKSVFTADAITLQPNGVYFAFMFVPDPGITGSSRDFVSGPVIPNSIFPLVNNVDVWLDGVLVDRTPGADAILGVQQKDVPFQGTSHLESLQVIWHPWDDDLTVGPIGNYDLRATLRDVGGSGWNIVAPFRVVPELDGDFNGSGTVDAADYVVWRKNDSSQLGYDTWRANFGRSVSDGSASDATVPEPATAILFVLGAAIGFWRARPTRLASSKTHLA